MISLVTGNESDENEVKILGEVAPAAARSSKKQAKRAEVASSDVVDLTRDEPRKERRLLSAPRGPRCIGGRQSLVLRLTMPDGTPSAMLHLVDEEVRSRASSHRVPSRFCIGR
jgi:hypothetical protein